MDFAAITGKMAGLLWSSREVNPCLLFNISPVLYLYIIIVNIHNIWKKSHQLS